MVVEHNNKCPVCDSKIRYAPIASLRYGHKVWICLKCACYMTEEYLKSAWFNRKSRVKSKTQ